MMGVPPDQARRLTYWEFTAMRHVWNDRHRDPDAPQDDGEPIELPTVEFVRARQAELAAEGYC